MKRALFWTAVIAVTLPLTATVLSGCKTTKQDDLANMTTAGSAGVETPQEKPGEAEKPAGK